MRKENTIINCVGEIPQRKNIKSSDMILINSVFPHWLQEICGSSSNCKLINITTDCVFSGKKGNYVETDVHDSLYLYGKSKSMGEPPEAMNIRTSIIGEEIYNKLSLLEWVKSMSNTSIEGFINHIWNGVTCLELTKHIESLLRDDIYIKGVRHLFTEEKCNKFQLVNTINDIWKLNIEIVPVNTELIDRSLNTIYKNNITKNIKQQLEELKDFDLYYKVGEISS
jgi:dTDP-4-dehydrorhamnose reductase